MTQLAVVISTVWIEGWLPWRRSGAFATEVHRLKTPSYGWVTMAGAVTAETLPVKVDLGEKITAPDDSAFMSL